MPVLNEIYERAEHLINTMNRQDIKMCNLGLKGLALKEQNDRCFMNIQNVD